MISSRCQADVPETQYRKSGQCEKTKTTKERRGIVLCGIHRAMVDRGSPVPLLNGKIVFERTLKPRT